MAEKTAGASINREALDQWEQTRLRMTDLKTDYDQVKKVSVLTPEMTDIFRKVWEAKTSQSSRVTNNPVSSDDCLTHFDSALFIKVSP